MGICFIVILLFPDGNSFDLLLSIPRWESFIFSPFCYQMVGGDKLASPPQMNQSLNGLIQITNLGFISYKQLGSFQGPPFLVSWVLVQRHLHEDYKCLNASLSDHSNGVWSNL